MEKFAVDLDKVLDEFEFNEDRAEQLLTAVRKGCVNNITSQINAKNNQQSGSVPYNLPVFEQVVDSSEANPDPYANNYSNTYSTAVKNRRLYSSEEQSEPFLQKENGLYYKDNLEKNPCGNRLNVSGVFSCLNDYINAASIDVNVGTVDVINHSYDWKESKSTFTSADQTDTSLPKFDNEALTNSKGMESHSYPQNINHKFPPYKEENCYTPSTRTGSENTIVTSEVCINNFNDGESESEATCETDIISAIVDKNVSDITDAYKSVPSDLDTSDESRERNDSAPEHYCISSNDSFVYGDQCVVEEKETNHQMDATVKERTVIPDTKFIQQLNSENQQNERVPIGFSSLDISDDELNFYLQELEEIYDSEMKDSVDCQHTEDCNANINKSSDINIFNSENNQECNLNKFENGPDSARTTNSSSYNSTDLQITRIVNSNKCENYSGDQEILSLSTSDEALNSDQTKDNLVLVTSKMSTEIESPDIQNYIHEIKSDINNDGDIAQEIKKSLYHRTSTDKEIGNVIGGSEQVNQDITVNQSELILPCTETSIPIHILGSSKTSKVTNVVSIECQQTKKAGATGLSAETSSVIAKRTNESCSVIVNNLEILENCDVHENANSFTDSSAKETVESTIVSESTIACEPFTDIANTDSNDQLTNEISSNDGSCSSVQDVSIQEMDKNGFTDCKSDDEKPCRPNFLHLHSKITIHDQIYDADPERNVTGQPGETPISSYQTKEEDGISNSINTPASAESEILTSPDNSESSSVEIPVSPPPPLLPHSLTTETYALTAEERNLGKYPPFWIPDADAQNCMLCNLQFTVFKRRHHCRACGKVLCSKCCSLRACLDYMDNVEARVCHICFGILAKVCIAEHGDTESEQPIALVNDDSNNSSTPLGRQPNPNNPMEYCSTIPPLEQAASALHQPVPSVLVPVGVLKREGSTRPKGDVAKQVMFSDGIRPGGDLTELDGSSEPRLPYRRQERVLKRVGTPPGTPATATHRALRTLPPLESNTESYIPSYKGLPPLASIVKGDLKLEEDVDNVKLFTLLKTDDEPPCMFALNRNLFVNVKILNLNCCVNRTCWCFSTIGMSSVGQDEIVIILECISDETTIPRDIFLHLNTVYKEASKGRMVSELGHTILQGGQFLGSSDYGGFIYIRPSFQCLHKLILPPAPYLVAILINRWEAPWAKVFPIRLMLRLGAEFRYYPCMLVSVRDRKPVYCEIGHTIINLLADFRNLSYTLPSVRGLVIHMEDRHTSILLPRNRYDQVTRALNNSNDHVLALAANFSYSADSHLVCIQSSADESYHTQAINIHNKPRKVTGASFVVFNGALKISSNLTAKSSIVEDGLMVQITPDTIQELRCALRNMKDFSVSCGPAGVEQPDEMVYIKWVEDDKNFNVGVKSLIDRRGLDGVPSIRVHNGTDYMGGLRFIRWTEVFILQSEENSERGNDTLDISRLSESIARATCLALINLLDLLSQAGLAKLAVRATIHPDNVGYEAGSNGEKLPPIYMNSLDNELIPVLHKAASMSQESPAVILELVFHVMLQ